jgi:hypothetical protein
MEDPGAVETHQECLVRYPGKTFAVLDSSAVVIAAAKVFKETWDEWLKRRQRESVSTKQDIWMGFSEVTGSSRRHPDVPCCISAP